MTLFAPRSTASGADDLGREREAPDERLELRGTAREILRGSGDLLHRRARLLRAGRHLLGRGRRLLGDRGDLAHVALYPARALGRLVDGGGDVGGAQRHLLDGRADGLEGLAGALDGGGAVGGAPRAVLDDVDGVARVGLDGADERGDRAGGRARLLGQHADLVGHDGEAAALLARAGGLDGGVERQQIGLRGDRGDGLDDAADLIGLGAELADGDRGRDRGLAHGRHRGADLAHGLGAGAGQAAGPVGRDRGLLSAVGGLRRRAGHLGHGVARRVDGAHLALGAGGDLVDGAGDLAHRAAGVLGAVGQLARGRRHGRGRQRHLPDHRRQGGARGVVGLHRGRGVVADLPHGLGHVADLVAGAPADRRGGGRAAGGGGGGRGGWGQGGRGEGGGAGGGAGAQGAGGAPRGGGGGGGGGPGGAGGGGEREGREEAGGPNQKALFIKSGLVI